MKKALSVFLMTAMAFGAFAQDAEPVADVNIAEFSGNAAVQWGVDLDSGTTGFKNSYEVNLKLNLLNNGTKSTTGDGVWGELVLKTEEDTFIGWENGDDSPEVGDEYINANTGLMGGGRNFGLKVYVDTAKIHIGPAYIGIKRGDTQTGELKMDAAIRSADDDQSKWLTDVGPADYSEGIVAGYDSDMFRLDLDLRSKPAVSRKEVSAFTWPTKVDDKDGSGTLTGGDVITFANGTTVTVPEDVANDYGNPPVDVVNVLDIYRWFENDATYYYTDNYAAALEGEFKGVENLSVKAGASYNFAKNYQADKVSKDKTPIGVKVSKDKTPIGVPEHILGYSASAGYKLGLNDTFFIRPQVGFTGTARFTTSEVLGKEMKTSAANAEMAAGLLFGWGEIGMDQNAGVYYLDDDMAKKVSPGVGVVAYIPFATTSKTSYDGKTNTTTTYKGIAARIMPSFYSGELVPGLTAAAYGDIVIPKTGEDKADGDTSTKYDDHNKDKATAMAFTFGAKYAIPVGEMTITPQAGIRFANAAYVNYSYEEKDDPVFGKMGDQKEFTGQALIDDKAQVKYDGNFMNLKLGVDVAGLVDNTTLSVVWATDNILNGQDTEKNNINKFGTLNFKAKIAL